MRKQKIFMRKYDLRQETRKMCKILGDFLSIVTNSTLILMGMIIGISTILSIIFGFYVLHLIDVIFIVFGSLTYFLHLLQRRKNPKLFNLEGDLSTKIYYEISYFGMSLGFVVFTFLCFYLFSGLHKLMFSNNENISIIFLVEKLFEEFSSKIFLFLVALVLIFIFFYFLYSLIFFNISRFWIKFNEFSQEKEKKLSVLLSLIVFFSIFFTLIFSMGTKIDVVLGKILENKIIIYLSKFLIGFPPIGFFRLLFYGNTYKKESLSRFTKTFC